MLSTLHLKWYRFLVTVRSHLIILQTGWVLLMTRPRHFLMLNDKLQELDSFYCLLPAHDRLWQAAEEKVNDSLTRLLVAPLIVEKRV